MDMRKSAFIVLLAVCLMLSGCAGWLDGSYSSVRPHTERNPQRNDQIVSVSSYHELRNALIEMVESSTETTLFNVAQMNQEQLSGLMQRAVEYIMGTNPIGAYAVEDITYEQGTSGGQEALSVTVVYNHNRADILRIKRAENMDEVKSIISAALDQCESRVVLMAESYRSIDVVQFVQDYANENPDMIMEVPQVTVNMYPEQGTNRVLEIVFSYQSSRESLRNMQSRVRPLFTSAELYVSGNHADHEKYAQLSSFLMERNEYTIETSITPSYSLLVHGVGDSKAFATVYAAMCRRAGLECMVVSGTWEGEPLFWNIICDDGVYYHVDLLYCGRVGHFQELTDSNMSGYVWDYSAYPQCIAPEPEPTEEPSEPQLEETE